MVTGTLAFDKQYKILNKLLSYKEIKNTLTIAELKEIRKKIALKNLSYSEAKSLIKKFSEVEIDRKN